MLEIFQIKITVAVLFIGIAVLNTGCAGSYHKISPALLEYTDIEVNKSLSYSYHFNVLRDFRNKRFAEKEKEKNIKIVAFEITNLSNRKIDLVNEVEYCQDSATILTPIKPNEAYMSFILSSRKYIPILFLSVLNYYWVETYGPIGDQRKNLRMIPIGIIIIPLLTLYNVESTEQSNLKFAEDLDKFTPFTRIHPGERKYILISFKDIIEQPIHIKVKSSIR